MLKIIRSYVETASARRIFIGFLNRLHYLDFHLYEMLVLGSDGFPLESLKTDLFKNRYFTPVSRVFF